MAISKIVYKASASATPEIWMDVTQDTVTTSTLLSAYTATKNDGTKITGEYEGVSLQSKSATFTPTTSTQTSSILPDSGYALSSVGITVNPIPSAYIIPTGTLSISQNGSGIDVASYASVDVNVAGGGGTAGADEIIQRTIANTYENSTVSFIGPYAFAECKEITTLSFANCLSVMDHGVVSCSKLTEVYAPKCAYVGNYAFSYCSMLSSITFDFSQLSFIGDYAFNYCRFLTSISCPNLSSIGSSAFNNIQSFTEAYFSAVTLVGNGAFGDCRSMTTFVCPELTVASGSAFYHCDKLSVISFSKLQSAGPGAFAYCLGVSIVSLPVCTSVGQGAFQGCASLEQVSLPECTTFGTMVFAQCTKLSSISLPKLSALGSSTFGGCFLLASVSAPLAESVYVGAFSNCSALTELYLPNGRFIASSAMINAINLSKVILRHSSTNRGFISNSAFASCYNLLSLYLLSTSLYSLQNINAFINTPISTRTTSTGGVQGSIYVPADTYQSYITSTNWVTYAARFVSMTDTEIETFLSNLT